MKNLFGFFNSTDVRVNGFESLNENEMLEIRGGTEPVRPVAPPRDRYDDEES